MHTRPLPLAYNEVLVRNLYTLSSQRKPCGKFLLSSSHISAALSTEALKVRIVEVTTAWRALGGGRNGFVQKYAKRSPQARWAKYPNKTYRALFARQLTKAA